MYMGTESVNTGARLYGTGIHFAVLYRGTTVWYWDTVRCVIRGHDCMVLGYSSVCYTGARLYGTGIQFAVLYGGTTVWYWDTVRCVIWNFFPVVIYFHFYFTMPLYKYSLKVVS
jgi:hypothetical protein